jgi:hypothetical protein
VKASIFFRIAAVLLVLFAAGHTLGFRQNHPEWGVGSVIGSMQSVHFNAQGFNRTYWEFFSAFGFFFSVLLLLAAVVAWQFGGVTAAGLWPFHAPHRVGAGRLLRRGYSFELEIPLHPPRFLSLDYSVFDCRSMALTEANLSSR